MLKKTNHFLAEASQELDPLHEQKDDPVLQNLIAERESRQRESVSEMPPSMFVPLLVKEMMKKQHRKSSHEIIGGQQNFLSQVHSGLNSNAFGVGSALLRRPSGENSEEDLSHALGFVSMSGSLQAPPSTGTSHSGAATPPTPLTPSVAETPRSAASSGGSRPRDAQTPDMSDDEGEWLVSGVDGQGSTSRSLVRYAMPDTPTSPRSPEIASTPRYLWPGEGLGLGLQTVFFQIEGERRTEIDELLKLLENIMPGEGRTVDDIMSQNEFWRTLERIEGKLLEDEDIDAASLDIRKMVRELQRAIAQENKQIAELVKAEVGSTEIINIDEDDYIFSQEVMRGTPRDATLTALMPELSDEEARRRFIKYNFYRTRYEGYDKLHGIKEEHHGEDHSHSAVPKGKHMSRKMSGDDIQRHRHATKQGALPPAATRPPGAFAVSKVSFGGPIIKGARPHKQQKKGGGHAHEGHAKEGKEGGKEKSSRPASALQARKMAVPLPDFRPPPPKMPNRSDLSRSSWLNPSANFEFSHKQRRREFIDKYKPTLISGLPPCPPPPGALRPLPLPGEDIPGHQIRLKNLPLGCTIEMVREYMGKHVDEIMPNWTRDGFKEGVKMLKKEDGRTESGECVVKFKSKKSAMYALIDMDRHYIGKKLIMACYELMPPVPDRGRLKVMGCASKTSSRDLKTFFNGFFLAPESDDQEPELLADDDGMLTGEAIITFVDVEAADHVLTDFDWNRTLHTKKLDFEPMVPIYWDEVSENWKEREQMGKSTVQLLTNLGWI